MEPFPEDATRYVDGVVDSVDQLDILFALGDRPDATWDAAAAAPVAGVDPAAAEAGLSALHARGLIAAERRPGGMVYRFGPAGPDLACLVATLLRLYRERPVTTIRAVYDCRRRAAGRRDSR